MMSSTTPKHGPGGYSILQDRKKLAYGISQSEEALFIIIDRLFVGGRIKARSSLDRDLLFLLMASGFLELQWPSIVSCHIWLSQLLFSPDQYLSLGRLPGFLFPCVGIQLTNSETGSLLLKQWRVKRFLLSRIFWESFGRSTYSSLLV